jgi:hypothetical protein
MPATWQDHLLEAIVAAAHAAGDRRLATAAFHPRRSRASVQHPQVRKLECQIGPTRKPGSQAQVLLIECQPKRGTETDSPTLGRELAKAGLGGEVHVEEGTVFLQKQWGHGQDAVFPVQDARRVKELANWAVATLSLLFDHLGRRQRIVTPVNGQRFAPQILNLRVALEQYLEDLLVARWDSLPWAQELEYPARQVECGLLGKLDILALDRASGEYVVIELKRDQGDDEVIGQVSRYMGWIKQHRANPRKVGVRGIIVAHEATDRLCSAVSAHSNISLYTYEFAVTLAPLLVPAQASQSAAPC